MRRNLVQLNQGHSQPNRLPLRRAVLWLVLACVAITTIAALASLGQRGAQPAIVQPIVLVSGRDDHGLMQQPQVTLQRGPEDSTVVGSLPDGSFARVIETRGEWLRVESLTEPTLSGWINDFHLRDRALRSDGQGQVRLVDARMAGGQLLIAVRPLAAPESTPTWLPAPLLREVGARP